MRRTAFTLASLALAVAAAGCQLFPGLDDNGGGGPSPGLPDASQTPSEATSLPPAATQRPGLPSPTIEIPPDPY